MPNVRVCIDVEDLEVAIRFYTEALGLKVARRMGAGVAELAGAGVPLDLLEKKSGSQAFNGSSQARSYARHWTPVHLDFVVDDIEATVRRVRALGGTLEGDIADRTFGKLALMADPFGHGLCVLEFRGRGYDEPG